MLNDYLFGYRQIPAAIAQRGVFYKQSMAGFYPTSCEVVSDTLVQSGLTVRAKEGVRLD